MTSLRQRADGYRLAAEIMYAESAQHEIITEGMVQSFYKLDDAFSVFDRVEGNELAASLAFEVVEDEIWRLCAMFVEEWKKMTAPVDENEENLQ